ncbi:MAG: hypothetical protein R3F17_01420 [Planctomycetota bacterium]
MKFPSRLLNALPLFALGACAMAPTHQSMPPLSTAGWENSVGQPGAVLYGRDGSPVGAGRAPQPVYSAAPQQQAPQPAVTATEGMPHRPEEASGSRPVLLELYQEVVSERENLALQLEVTQDALKSCEDRILDLEQRMQAEIEARTSADAAKEEALAQSADLGRRLAVAQMRRLEAEKMLLEKTLAERRKLAESAE